MSKENTREIILETATRLFQTKGFNSIGMSEIIKESGAPKGSLYYHFPNGKEQIILEAIQQAAERIRIKVKTDLGKEKNFVEALDDVIENMMASIESTHNEISYSISLMALESVGTSDKLRLASQTALQQMEQLYIDKALICGIESGNARALGSFVQTVLEGAYTEALIFQSSHVLRNVQEQLHKVLPLYIEVSSN